MKVDILGPNRTKGYTVPLHTQEREKGSYFARKIKRTHITVHFVIGNNMWRHRVGILAFKQWNYHVLSLIGVLEASLWNPMMNSEQYKLYLRGLLPPIPHIVEKISFTDINSWGCCLNLALLTQSDCMKWLTDFQVRRKDCKNIIAKHCIYFPIRWHRLKTKDRCWNYGKW